MALNLVLKPDRSLKIRRQAVRNTASTVLSCSNIPAIEEGHTADPEEYTLNRTTVDDLNPAFLILRNIP